MFIFLPHKAATTLWPPVQSDAALSYILLLQGLNFRTVRKGGHNVVADGCRSLSY